MYEFRKLYKIQEKKSITKFSSGIDLVQKGALRT